MKNILLALDVNHFRAEVVDYTLGIAKAMKAKIWALHVVPDLNVFIGYDDGPDYIRLDLAKEIRAEHRFLQSLAALVRQHEVEADALLVNGEIVQCIISESKKLKVDLIVTGVNKHGFLTNMIGGNTALEIIKRSTIPLLCYPFQEVESVD